ncbi:Mrp/NBP35 family ATP-binding protein [Rhizorhabdus argentea]|uniref:Mrp/NBP35 family ATP-binding protein n=1 Tax=Rhizorhabdus argentea TaxID=1387174 RepID=UPI0030EF91CA
MQMTDSLPKALDSVIDPISGKGLIASGRSAEPRYDDGTVSVVLDVTGLSGDARSKLETAVKQALIAVPGVDTVRVAMTAEKRGRKIIAIGSGKGGVGKSTLSANLAVALRRMGKKVGLVDADIYGPSQPRLLSTEGMKPTATGQKMDPVMSPFGVPMLSMGQLVKPGQAIAWRGPMAANALGQLIDAEWGDVDLLILDLPPGTGDVQLTMVQKYKPAGAIIVSTPQDLALIDATRAIDFFNQASVPIVGMVENMAGYACPHCGEISDPFGQGGAQAAALSMGLDFLGRVPLDIAIRTKSDAGTPPAAEADDVVFAALAARITDWLNPAKPGAF